MSPAAANRRSLLAAVLLAAVACALSISTYRVFGHTWDEPSHVAAGLDLLERHDYIFDEQHPPLGRLAAAIGPYLAGARLPADAARPDSPWGTDLSGEREGRDVLYQSPLGYEQTLTLARLGMLPFLVLLVLATWAFAREAAGPGAAALAAGVLVTTPVILGHGAIAALDLPMVALAVLAIWLLVRWIEGPTLGRTLLLGLVSGLAIATKLSAIPFLGLAGVALLLAHVFLRPPRSGSPPWGRWLGFAVVAGAIALAVWVASYGDRTFPLTDANFRPNKALDFLAGKEGAFHDFVYGLAAKGPLPLGVEKTLLGLYAVTWHNSHGHASYLLGETRLHGWWYFYLVALAVKTPLPLLLLGLPGLGLLGVRGIRQRELMALAPALCFVVLLVFCCAYSHINIGVRHVLILYPLLAMGAGALVAGAWRARGALRLPGRMLATGLLAWQVATVALAWPDYLAYFNFTAGDHPERILVDSDLDWGQDLRRLSAELKRREVPAVAIGYRGSANLHREDLPPYVLLEPGRPVRGWVAIDMLTKVEGRPAYDWLDQYEPVTRVGQSIDLYYIGP